MSDRSYSPDPSREGQEDEGQPEASSSFAPYRHLPQHAYGAIEYPGTVSYPSAITTLCTQEDINDCFNAPAAENRLLEMSYHLGERTCVPVRGHRVPSQKLLLKVTKRRRKHSGDSQHNEKDQGVFTSEVMGPITQTVRFRGMADYHYTPDPNGRISQLVNTLSDLNYESILEYSVPDLDEKYDEVVEPEEGEDSSKPRFRSLLDLQGTPVYNDRQLPRNYNFKQLPQTVIEPWEDEYTGQIRKRFVNQARYVALGAVSIGHEHKPEDVPQEPPPKVVRRSAKLNRDLLNRLKELFAKRPVWMRHSVLAQFSEADARLINLDKAYIPAVSYTIDTGPFWKCLIRYGYDPTREKDAYIYQRVWFYYMPARPKGNPTIVDPDEVEVRESAAQTAIQWRAEQEELVEQGKRPPFDRTRVHIFDGKVLHRHRPDYQLCDVEDTLIKRYIYDPWALKDECDARDGWFKPANMELIKTLVKYKFGTLRRDDRAADDSECADIIERFEKGGEVERNADEEEPQEEGMDVDD